MHSAWRAEIPLLANDLMWLSHSGHPSQHELLCARSVLLVERQCNAFDILWSIEDEPYDLRACFRRPPSALVPSHQRSFNRILWILGSHFHRGCLIQLQPSRFGTWRALPDRTDQTLPQRASFRRRSPLPRWNMCLPFTFLRGWRDFSRASASLAGSPISICPPPFAHWAPLIHCHINMISPSGVVESCHPDAGGICCCHPERRRDPRVWGPVERIVVLSGAEGSCG